MSFKASDVPRVSLYSIGLIHPRRRVSPKAAHKSRIQELVSGNKGPGVKRKWR